MFVVGYPDDVPAVMLFEFACWIYVQCMHFTLVGTIVLQCDWMKSVHNFYGNSQSMRFSYNTNQMDKKIEQEYLAQPEKKICSIYFQWAKLVFWAQFTGIAVWKRKRTTNRSISGISQSRSKPKPQYIFNTYRVHFCDAMQVDYVICYHCLFLHLALQEPNLLLKISTCAPRMLFLSLVRLSKLSAPTSLKKRCSNTQHYKTKPNNGNNQREREEEKTKYEPIAIWNLNEQFPTICINFG